MPVLTLAASDFASPTSGLYSSPLYVEPQIYRLFCPAERDLSDRGLGLQPALGSGDDKGNCGTVEFQATAGHLRQLTALVATQRRFLNRTHPEVCS